MAPKLNINNALKGINEVKNFVCYPLEGVKVSSPKSDRKQEILFEFESQGSFYEWLRQTWEGLPTEYRLSSVEHTPSRSWDLGAGLQGIKKIHELGWEEGIKKLVKASAQFPTAGSEGQIPDTDICGGTLDVPAFLSGVPDHWDIDPEEDSIGKTNLVKIIAPLQAHCGVTTDKMMYRGLAIVSAVKSLSASKKQTEIWVEESSQAGTVNVTFRVCLKKGCDPISLNDIVCWIGHPATFRRMMFQAIETTFPLIVKSGQTCHDYYRGGYGQPSHSPTEGLGEGTVIIPTYSQGTWSTPDNAMDCLSDCFKKAGYSLEFNQN